MKLRKIAALAMATALCATTLAACGKPSSSGSTQGTGSTGGQANKVSIELLTWHGPESATNYYAGYEAIAKDYMETHSNVNITIKYEDDKVYGNILETGFAGDTAPDIIQMKSSQRSTYAQNLLNLRSYLEGASPYDTRNSIWAENFVGGMGAFPGEEADGVSNALLFIPNDGNPEVTAGKIYVYNKAIVKNAGLDPEKAPTTWTEMFTWLEALSQVPDLSPIAGNNDVGGKVSQIGYMFGSEFADEFFAPEFNDAEFKDDLFYDKLYILTCYDKGTEMPLDNLPFYPAMFALMKQHISYYQKSWTENSTETEILTFASGKAAMINSTFWDFGTLAASLSDNQFPDGYGVFAIPYMGDDTLAYAVTKGWITQAEADAATPYIVDRPGDSSGVGRHEYGFTVNANVAQDEAKLAAVIDFLQYLTSKETQEKYVEIAQSISPVKDVPIIDLMQHFIVDEPAGGFAKHVVGLTVIEWGKSGWDIELMKFLKNEQGYQETVANISHPEWAGDIPAQDALAQAVTDAKAELESAKEDAKAGAEHALKYAELREKLYNNYFYDMAGNLSPAK